MQNVIQAVLPQMYHCNNSFIFRKGNPLVIHVTFFIDQPISNFRGGTRDVAHQLENYNISKYRYHVRTPDVENLKMFIQDKPMERFIYHNDSNLVEARSKKLRENAGPCRGCIKIAVTEMDMDLTAEEGKEDTIVI